MLANESMAPCGCSVDWAAATSAVRHILKSAYKIELLKALDPLDQDDFLVIVQTLANDLYAASQPLDTKSVEAALLALDVDWANLSDAQIAETIHAANLAMRDIPAKVIPKVETKIKASLKTTIRGTKASAVDVYDLGISASLNLADKNAVDVLGSIGTWVVNEYGRRIAMFDTNVQAIVEDGLAQGLRSADIAEDLQKLGTKFSTNRPKNYWRLVSMNLTNRARSYGHITSIAEAGIQNYIFLAVMDERTSLICRSLHEQVFPVSIAVEKFSDLAIETAGDFQAVESVMPFVSQQRRSDGSYDMFIEPPGRGRTTLGVALTNPIGTVDKKPSVSGMLSPAELSAAGVTIPPVHQACRSTIVPEI